jgi:hypothetical protein
MSDSGFIPPDFDRNGPDAGLIDPTTGARIGDLQDFAGAVRGPDGLAMPSEIFAAMPRGPQDHGDYGDSGYASATEVAEAVAAAEEAADNLLGAVLLLLLS